MYNNNLSEITNALAEQYILLKQFEELSPKQLVLGKAIYREARRLQEEFFPMSDSSEKIVMTLLNQKFVYDSVDYSNEVDDEMLITHCDVGLLLYMTDAIVNKINIINKSISDLQGAEAF